MAVDVKSQIQALDRTAPCLPILPTTPERRTHDYVRHGTTSLFAAYDLASGSVIAQHYRRHRHQEFLRFLKLIDTAVPEGPGPAPGAGQLRHPQDPGDQRLAAEAPAVPPALHARPAPPGSTWSSGGSPSSPTASSAGQPTAASPSSRPTSASGSTSGTRTRSRSSGPSPPTRSSKPSPTTANELSTQDTSGADGRDRQKPGLHRCGGGRADYLFDQPTTSSVPAATSSSAPQIPLASGIRRRSAGKA